MDEAVGGRGMGIWNQNRMGGQKESFLFLQRDTWAGIGLVPLCPMATVEGPLQGGLSRFHLRELPEKISLTCKLQIATDPGVSS